MLQILGPTWLPKSEGVENTLLAMLFADTYELYLPRRDWLLHAYRCCKLSCCMHACVHGLLYTAAI